MDYNYFKCLEMVTKTRGRMMWEKVVESRGEFPSPEQWELANLLHAASGKKASRARLLVAGAYADNIPLRKYLEMETGESFVKLLEESKIPAYTFTVSKAEKAAQAEFDAQKARSSTIRVETVTGVVDGPIGPSENQHPDRIQSEINLADLEGMSEKDIQKRIDELEKQCHKITD